MLVCFLKKSNSCLSSTKTPTLTTLASPPSPPPLVSQRSNYDYGGVGCRGRPRVRHTPACAFAFFGNSHLAFDCLLCDINAQIEASKKLWVVRERRRTGTFRLCLSLARQYILCQVRQICILSLSTAVNPEYTPNVHHTDPYLRRH